jgi:tRNA-dihydrouridine synthase C
LLALFRERVKRKVAARHVPGRIKQWLHLLARNYPQAQQLFATLRALRTLAEVEAALVLHGVPSLDEHVEQLAEAA